MLSLLVLLSLGSRVDAQGQWQGGVAPADASTTLGDASAQLVVSDTGGSGGTFGKGDIRARLRAVNFWNQTIGWAAGDLGALRTTDGGMNWIRLRPQGSGFLRVVMTGPSDVWLLENNPPGGLTRARLWHTRDDGTNWEEALASQIGSPCDLAGADGELFVLCGKSTSFRSQDRGAHWTKFRCGDQVDAVYQIAIPGDVPARSTGEPTLYVLGSFKQPRQVIRSDDGGESWKLLSTPQDDTSHAVTDKLFFATTQHGWLGGADGTCYETIDGGQSWQARPLPVRKPVTALWFDQLGRGFAAVANIHPNLGVAAYETADGGRNWRLLLNGSKQVNAFWAFGPGDVWAVGDVPGRTRNDLVIHVTRMPSIQLAGQSK